MYNNYCIVYVVLFDDIIEFIFDRKKDAIDYINRCYCRNHYTIEEHKLYLQTI